MKKIILLAALLSAPLTQADDKIDCEEIAELASVMMSARQAGVPLKMVIGSMDKDFDLGKKMALDAYDIPRFETERYKEKTIGDYADKWYLACLKAQ